MTGTEPFTGGQGRIRAPANRDDFFAAQRRHRRAARRYTVLATIAVLLQSLPAALMLAPVIGGIVVLGADLLNLLIPVPDLLQPNSQSDPATQEPLSAGQWSLVLAAVTLPGLVIIALLWWWVLRVLLRTGLGGVLVEVGVRPPDHTDFEEHQFANVVAEASLAAGIATPAVLILDDAGANAAAIGASPDEATIIVTRRLLDRHDREETQGIVAHLVGSVANGDLRIANVILAVSVTYGLMAVLLTAPVRRSRHVLRLVWRALRHRTPQAESQAIRAVLSSDGGNSFLESVVFLTWRLMVWITNLFFVGPTLMAPWRTRRYLADATAVQLTRDPRSLVDALTRSEDTSVKAPLLGYAATYFIVSPIPPGGSDLLGDDVGIASSVHPPLQKRIERLQRLDPMHTERAQPGRLARGVAGSGAGVARFAIAAVAYVVLMPLLAVVMVALGLCVLALVMVCVQLGLLMYVLATAVIVLPLHAILRSLG